MKKKNNKKTIGIVGLGYVGLPLLLKFINSKKYKIIGFDTNLKKIINFTPRVKIESGIRDFVEWYKSFYKVK
tara:strand:+ start:383 stop:598 length:216 start_codon:yes stop_codon:yes gene_type:complete